MPMIRDVSITDVKHTSIPSPTYVLSIPHIKSQDDQGRTELSLGKSLTNAIRKAMLVV